MQNRSEKDMGKTTKTASSGPPTRGRRQHTIADLLVRAKAGEERARRVLRGSPYRIHVAAKPDAGTL